MSLIPAKCVEFRDKRKFCVASEKGKKYQLTNNSAVLVRKVKVDGCLAQQVGEKRCDFLMDVEEKEIVYFIELKGGELNKAVKQIYSTIVYLRAEFKNFRFEARIAGSKDIPGFINTPDYKKLAREILPTGGKIERSTNNIYIETI